MYAAIALGGLVGLCEGPPRPASSQVPTKGDQGKSLERMPVGDHVAAELGDDGPDVKRPGPQKVYPRGLVLPKNHRQIVAACLKRQAPGLTAWPKVTATSYDSVAAGFVTDVKDQGGCGDCFLFAATAGMETALLKSGMFQPADAVLNEQFPLDCAHTDACEGGWAEQVLQFYVDTGALKKADYPGYVQTPRNCRAYDKQKLIKIDSYAYVTGADTQSTVQQLKDAVVAKGGIIVPVAANSKWDAYRPGQVIEGADDGINHEVMIVGFDDAKGSKGAWKVKNSWSKNWGEGGYCWVGYGACSIGYGALFAVATKDVPVPPPPPPPPVNFPNGAFLPCPVVGPGLITLPQGWKVQTQALRTDRDVKAWLKQRGATSDEAESIWTVLECIISGMVKNPN